ncbi:DNA mismatch repair protein MutS [Bradyrhizobium sp. 83002]|uniref:Smr/MutS family protein n=1 Tax=Bradyrhizobium aeschynomenes TaxID=2734909 RepID=UPI0015556FB1|nr:Smr/MutS family protein [Bradyrhizobium aeschynomenes]NPU11718.1 DNA mismatch repair protein MutS [Bradyrhizobium aeschynomenes]NPV22366.1 DNA mismatch repair protein MutS [Bradyrhizobium aeschynomenes]
MSHDPEPPRGRRKRGLSEDERVLWETVARQVKPLRKTPRPLRLHPPMATAEPQADKAMTTPRPVAPVVIPKPVRPAIPPLVSLGRKERSKLSRGRSEIDARLDLHGMTQSRAHQALHHFLHRAQHDGLTFVLVITGKGTIGADPERGVLRRQVPHWLSLPEFRSLIVGFEEAHVGHGGAGALYVRIRRPRG